MAEDLLGEVGRFLADLKLELPGLFPAGRTVRGRPLPFQGVPLSLRVVSDPARTRSGVEEQEGGLTVLRAPEDPARPAELLRDWYVERASAVFAERVAHWSGAMGVKAGSVRVKDQRSLWGSCSREGNLNFNWRLVMAPPEVLDYLVIHELAHRLEMNHSHRFWGHVARFCPEHKARRRWLRDNARELHARLRG